MNKAFEKILERLEEERELSYADFSRYVEEVSPCLDDEYDDFFHRGLERASRLVKEVAEEYNGGWIPCSERLPEKNGMYLCTQNRYDLATNKKIIRVSTELVEFYNGEWRRAKNLVITHWQSLPEPFKEREAND